MNFFRLQLAVLLLGLVGLSWGGVQRWVIPPFSSTAVAAEEAPSNEELPAPALTTAPTFPYVGTASCAASNCHGGGKRPLGNHEDPLSPQAYSLWIQKDPHSRAYSTLFNAASQRMAERLASVNPENGKRTVVPAHEMQACLNCHTLNPPATQLATPHRHTLSDGVGCEACHGPAGKWNELHTRVGWSELTAIQKAATGFRNLDDLQVRGAVCIDCHIGGPGRDVNHDLIAAGHPRLNFELSAFHATMPKHWKNEDSERGHPEKVEARLFLVGQSLSALAALDQLERRADYALDGKAPWPEFAEYDCYACHHQLNSPSWRLDRDYSKRKAGDYPWGTWHFAMLPGLVAKPDKLAEQLRVGADTIAQAMSPAYPNEEAVKRAVQQVRPLVQALMQQTSGADISAEELRAATARLTSESMLAAGGAWEIEAQRFLAVSALRQSLVAEHRAKLNQSKSAPLPTDLQQLSDELEQIRGDLLFSKPADIVRYDSPQAYDAQRQRNVATGFERIHQLFQKP